MVEEGRIGSVRVLEVQFHVGGHILLVRGGVDTSRVAHTVKDQPFLVLDFLDCGIIEQRGEIHPIRRSSCGAWKIEPCVAALTARIFFGAEPRGIGRKVMGCSWSVKAATVATGRNFRWREFQELWMLWHGFLRTYRTVCS